jgi:hypothetical protein
MSGVAFAWQHSGGFAVSFGSLWQQLCADDLVIEAFAAISVAQIPPWNRMMMVARKHESNRRPLMPSIYSPHHVLSIQLSGEPGVIDSCGLSNLRSGGLATSPF